MQAKKLTQSKEQVAPIKVEFELALATSTHSLALHGSVVYDNVTIMGSPYRKCEYNGRQFQHDNNDAIMANSVIQLGWTAHLPLTFSHARVTLSVHTSSNKSSTVGWTHENSRHSPRSRVPCTIHQAVGSTPAVHSCGWTCSHPEGTPAFAQTWQACCCCATDQLKLASFCRSLNPLLSQYCHICMIFVQCVFTNYSYINSDSNYIFCNTAQCSTTDTVRPRHGPRQQLPAPRPAALSLFV